MQYRFVPALDMLSFCQDGKRGIRLLPDVVQLIRATAGGIDGGKSLLHALQIRATEVVYVIRVNRAHQCRLSVALGRI